MLSSSEIAILESLAHGGKDWQSLLSVDELSMISGATLDQKTILESFAFLKREKLITKDALSEHYILSVSGKTALEKADQQRLIRQNFQLLESQLKSSNDLSGKLIQELHDQSERSDKQRKDAEEKQDRDKWIQLLLGWFLGIGSTVFAQVILKWLGLG